MTDSDGPSTSARARRALLTFEVSSDESNSDKTITPREREAIAVQKLVNLIDCDSEDGRALVPPTRTSITGQRPVDLLDDEIEIDSSDDEEDAERPILLSNSFHHRTSKPGTYTQRSSSTSDVQVTDKRQETIELMSSDSDDEVSIMESASTTTSNPFKKSILRPKIKAARRKARSRAKPYNHSSKDFFRNEKSKLEDKKAEFIKAFRAIKKICNSQPDGGLRLKRYTESLRAKLENRSKYGTKLVIDESQCKSVRGQVDFRLPLQPPHPAPKHKPIFTNDVPDWGAFSAAINRVKPNSTSEAGIAKFNHEKAITIDSLKFLHNSLKNCPTEDVLAEDPKGLTVALMNHQKHALAWMYWREEQKPFGGILADDMGLGKMLTMISLVLATKNREGKEDEASCSKEEASNSENEEKENMYYGWLPRGRKSFYNGSTLVVCPVSLIRQWEVEIEQKLKCHMLTVFVHHGNNRDVNPKHLRTYDIVLTTYNIVAREHEREGALFGMKWGRIILDEAHVVRNHKTQVSVAVCALRGNYRWALTGTPIHNKEMDVFALVKFLRCTPFNDLGFWKRWLAKSRADHPRLNMVMKTLMLRRTKVQLQGRGELQSLPEKRIELINVELNKDEMDVYQIVMIHSRSLFAQFLWQHAEHETELNYPEDTNHVDNKMPDMDQNLQSPVEVKTHEILVFLLRLQQICCHPGLIDKMLRDDQNFKSDNKVDYSELTHLLDFSYHHRKIIARESARLLQRSNPVFDFKQPSSKIIKVLETLKKLMLGSEDKVIVVSQWTKVLSIFRTILHEQGIITLSLHGKVKNRQAIVTEFNNPASRVRVLLLSLMAGGVGLNLIGANHLMLIDLHWNPQMEAQAQDRIYRVGQTKNVIIYKFMCKDTIEERIKALQDKKIAIADGVLTGARSSISKLTMNDIRVLFG